LQNKNLIPYMGVVWRLLLIADSAASTAAVLW